jgi:putative ABC transport system permease protein
MLKNYFKIALRNLLRSKSFSAINILGLAIGMASAVLILLWIENEVSHDKFLEKRDRLYIVNNRDRYNGELFAWNTTCKPLGPALKHEYPDVEEAVRVSNGTFLFTVGDKHLNAEGIFADSGFLNMFSFPLAEGNVHALRGNYNIVLTQKMAKKLFGNEDAMGKVVRVDSTDNFIVSGVLKDLPNNTRFDFQYILPWQYLTKIGGDDKDWGNNSVKTFILLKAGVPQNTFDAKIKDISIRHSNKTDEKFTTTVFTQLLSDAWLYSKAENGVYVSGRIEIVKLFGIIAAFILLIACINFMNLSTARSEKRAKEVGIRKVAGAQKSSLVMQFIGESLLLSFFAGVIAILLVVLSLPGFNLIVNKELSLDFTQPLYWLFTITFIIITGLLAGSYPAFYLSSYQPSKVLKGTFKAANALVTPRKVLVVLQFTFAITLIICTIIVQHQIKFAQARDTGYSRDNLIYTTLQGEIEKHYDVIKNELLNKSAAVAVTKSMSPASQRYSDGWGFSWAGCTEEDKKMDFIRMASDADFAKTLGVKLLQGRDIDIKNYPADSTALLINEAALKAMRLKDPIGQIVKEGTREWRIIGVVKDFIFESPYQKINPLLVFGPKSFFSVMHIKLNPAKPVSADLDITEQVFKQYNPQYPFDYKFIDEEYTEKFQSEKRTGALAGLFAGLTIFISCLGLFGLATYMAQNRIKEIGVRKVLGASVSNISALLSKDFLALVIISYIIASPVAWWAMNSWLQSYSYRINIEWWVFAIAGVLSIIIALTTVSYQAIKAAVTNPVKSLRTE